MFFFFHGLHCVLADLESFASVGQCLGDDQQGWILRAHPETPIMGQHNSATTEYSPISLWSYKPDSTGNKLPGPSLARNKDRSLWILISDIYPIVLIPLSLLKHNLLPLSRVDK